MIQLSTRNIKKKKKKRRINNNNNKHGYVSALHKNNITHTLRGVAKVMGINRICFVVDIDCMEMERPSWKCCLKRKTLM